MLNIWTSRYNYRGPHRLDITVKGGDTLGGCFAPTWAMVRANKYCTDRIDTNYISAYLNKMYLSFHQSRNIWDGLLKSDQVVLVCFCKENHFCHRYILAYLLELMGAKYNGEIGTDMTDPLSSQPADITHPSIFQELKPYIDNYLPYTRGLR